MRRIYEPEIEETKRQYRYRTGTARYRRKPKRKSVPLLALPFYLVAETFKLCAFALIFLIENILPLLFLILLILLFFH